jgi:uncharacterized protein (DUF302 family)
VVKNSFNSLILQLSEALKNEGFSLGGQTNLSTGVVNKNGVYISNHAVLSAYVPFLYDEMMALAPFEGIILPCLISVIELHPGEIGIVPINPTQSIVAGIDSPSLQNISEEVSRRLERAILAIQQNQTGTPDLVTSWS